MRCTIPKLVESMPARPRTFRVFKSLKRAVTYIERIPCDDDSNDSGARLHKSCYGSDPRDVRYVVNMYGSVPRPRVKLTRVRVLMWNGISFNRNLPVVIS